MPQGHLWGNMGAMTTWAQWRNRTIPAGVSTRQVAAATGDDNKSVTRWLEQPRADWVIRLARAYGADPIGGLVAAGFLREDEVPVTTQDAVRLATSEQLAAELHKRTQDRSLP